MTEIAPLPLPMDQLPQAIRRFCDPSGPAAPRMMAARGLVPVKGPDQITLLAQLSADPDSGVGETARKSLANMPDAVLLPACETALHPSVLQQVAHLKKSSLEVLSRIAANPATANSTVARIASHADEALCERIAVNEQRLLGAPEIIEALYKNRNARMSTADRLIELAARNGLHLDGIPAFKEHAEALLGQLIPEPTDEPLPGDVLFREALDSDGEDSAVECDEVEGTEEVKEKFKPLVMRIRDMTVPEKIRMALVGNAAARALLVRDRNRTVSYAAISSPSMTVREAADIAKSKEVSEEILRYIGNKREWLRSGELKRALVFNPKTPVGITVKYVSQLHLHDLRKLARSRNVAGQTKAVALRWLERRQRG